MTNQPSAENVERAYRITDRYVGGQESMGRLVNRIAQTLHAVEDEAERRGAVKYLRAKAIDMDCQADSASTEFEFHMLRRVGSILFGMANELEQQPPQREGE